MPVQGEFFQNPGGSSVFYDFQINQSLRIDYGSANYLERAVPGGAGTNAKWSASCWVKRSRISTANMILMGNAAGYQQNQWDSDDTFHITTGGGSGDSVADDNFKFRDTTGWYHMAFGAGSNSSERFIYVNGVALTKILGRKFMSDKKDMSDMTASEISYRKFLKNLGVTTHKEIEKLINKKIADGELSPKSNLDITANIKIDELGLNHSISSTFSLPGKDD